MSDEPTVQFEHTHRGRRLALRLCGGPGNVIDTTMARELEDILRNQVDGRHLRAITLEAEGKNFSFGASVPEHAPELAARLVRALHRTILTMVDLDLPILVAVRGNCLGGGLELVLPCHRVFAHPAARLGLPEVTLGMFPPAGSVLLPERAPRGVAEEMLLTGRILDGNEALAAFIVDELHEEPEAAAVRWFEENLLSKSATALRFATRAARASYRLRVRRTLLELEDHFLDELMLTADAREGVASFLAKRPPVWVDA